MKVVVGMPAQTEVGHVGAADDDRARVLQVADDGGVAFRKRALVADDALGRGRAGDIDVFLHGDGNAVQGAELLAGGDGGIGGIGRRQRFLGQKRRDRVDLVVDGVDTVQMRPYDLAAR